MPHKDPEKRREYDRLRMRKWRAANKEKVRTSNAIQRSKSNWKTLQREWRVKNPESIKAAKRRCLLKRYGLTEAAYNKFLDDQKNKCKICLADFSNKLRPNVDHDHKTGLVRALLCSGCNGALGLAKDNGFVLARMIAYLKQSGTLPKEDLWSSTSFVDLR